MQYNELLALDIGRARVGVARANAIARIAEPLETLHNDEKLLENINRIAKEHHVDVIVVGLPKSLDFTENNQTKYTREITDRIAKSTGLKVVFSDEALSSVDAKHRLDSTKKHYQKADVDAVAAAVILDNFMNIEMSKR